MEQGTLPLGAAYDDFLRCRAVVADFIGCAVKDLDRETVRIMNVSCSIGGNYSEQCIRAICHATFENG